MKSCGIPGAVSNRELATRVRLRRVPGALVVSVGDMRDTLLVSLLHYVVVLDAGDRPPGVIHAGREERGCDGVKVDAGRCTLRALVDRRADGDP
jgi:hypothetical protein